MSTSAGDMWYKLEAFRAINQAVGRVIRHKDDFGAIIFLDKRFQVQSTFQELSDWVKASTPRSGAMATFEDNMRDIAGFFKSSLTSDLKKKVQESKQQSSVCGSSRHGCQIAIAGFFRSYVFGPSGLLDYGSATLSCKI